MGAAKSLRGLIARLVDEVAIYGTAGALPSEFIHHVKVYYAEPSDDKSGPPDDEDSLWLQPDDPPPTIDTTFLEYVWRLLIRDPDVRVGEHDQYEHFTLAEALTGGGVGAPLHDRRGKVPVAAIPSVSTDLTDPNEIGSRAPQDVNGRRVDERGQDKNVEGGPAAPIAASTLEEASNSTANVLSMLPAQSESGRVASRIGSGIRLYASENRMWYAIAGHEPDYNRIKNLDFICLSIIAACGPKGIPQHDLVRVSGQDKRSLPHRTDRLHKDGYIIKRPVSVLFDGTRLMHTSLCTLKRFAEASKATATELSAAANDGRPVRKRKKTLGKKEALKPVETSSQRVSTVTLDTHEETTSTGNLQQWTPDRNLINQIFDVVHRSGSEGVTLGEISANLLGLNYKRAIEDLVAKLVNSWQVSQPLHLRHLAIVRDTIQRGKAPVYIHYTYDNFQKLVENGQKVWEAVSAVSQDRKKGKVTIPPLDAKPELDEYGFPMLDPNQFQGLHNDASLIECVPVSGSAELNTDGKGKIIGVDSIPERALANINSKDKGGIASRKNRTTKVIKGRGRPRKYQSVGIPTDINSWGLDDMRALVESRRTAEKYQKSKIVDEIQRRIAQGGDVVAVTHEVLEVTDGLRKEQGEEPMSNFLVKQILHEHAGGPEPSAEEDPLNELKELIKSTHDTSTYPQGKWPRRGRPLGSSSATTKPTRTSEGQRQGSPILVPQKYSTGFETIGSRTRRRRGSVLVQSSLVHDEPTRPLRTKSPQMTTPYRFLPSVAAHSQLHHHVPLQQVEVGRESRKKRRGRPPKRRIEEPDMPRSLPSTAAHSTPLPLPARGLSDASAVLEMPPPKRQKVALRLDYDAATAHANASVTPYHTSVATHEMSNTAVPSHGNRKIESARVQQLMSEKYERAEKSIHRPCDGVFIGQTAQRYKRKGDPESMTTRTYQLAIFKLGSLKHLDWFVEEQSITNGTNMSPSPEQNEKTQDPGHLVIKLPALKIMPLSVENRPLTQSEKLQVYPGQKQGTDPPQREVDIRSLVTDDEETEEDMVTAPSSPISAGHQQPERPKPSGYSSASTTPGLRPTTANLRMAWLPPRLGTFSHKGPLPGAFTPPLETRKILNPRTSRVPRIRANATPHARMNQVDVTPTSDLGQDSSHDAIARASAPEPNHEAQINHLKATKNISNAPAIEATNSSSDSPQAFPSKTTTSLVGYEDTESTHALGLSDNRSTAVETARTSGIHNTDATRRSTRVEVVDSESVSRLSTCEGARIKPVSTPNRSVIHDNKSYYTKPTAEEQRKAIVGPLRKPRNRNTAARITLTGGSTAILRRDIVMGLVQKCGGVFPGVPAMRAPFTSAWKSRGQSGNPERNTIAKAVDLLCVSGKLQRIVFSFRNNYGGSDSATMFALPEIDPHDQKVKDTQERIKERSPHLFVPAAVMPADRLDARAVKRREIQRGAAERKASTDEARAMALKSPEERAAYLTALKTSNRSEQEVAALTRLAKSSTGIVKRLGTIKGPAVTRRMQKIQRPPKTTLPKASTPQASLTWLPQELAFSDDGLGKDRHTFFPSKDPPGGFLPRQEMLDLATKSAQLEDNQAECQTGEPSLLYTDFGTRLPHTSSRRPVYVEGSSQIHGPPAFAQAHYAQLGHQSYPPVRLSTSSADISPSPEVLTKPATGRMKRKHDEEKIQMFPSFMSPIHHYHSATGTFNASFVGLRIGVTAKKRSSKGYGKVDLPVGWKSPFAAKLSAGKASSKEVRRKSPPAPANTNMFLPVPQSTDFGTFETEIYRVLNWELQTGGFADMRWQGWPFVSFNAPQVHQTEGDKNADVDNAQYLTHNAEDGRGVNKNTNAVRTANANDSITIQQPNNVKKRLIDSIKESSTIGVPDQTPTRPFKVRRIRGPQNLRTLGENGELRLYTAVLVVRVLAGGIRQRIDWRLVARVFLPERDETFIRSKWSAVQNRLRPHVMKMDAQFQTLFARAYEEGTVPKIDFDHLEDYDWKWLVDWTMARLETPKNTAPELPADRAAFDQTYIIKDASVEEDLGHFYEFEGLSVSNLRRAVINRHAYVCHLLPNGSTPQSPQAPTEEEQLGIARTWIRANILAPAKTYDPQAARAKLLTLPDPVIDAALKSLVQDRSIIEENKGRLVPGRNYVISDFFKKRLGRNINPAQLYRAVAFKLQLDRALEADGRARWSYTADDGDAMAVLNLLANRRVKILPINPPLDKWGQTEGGYETRQMDKKKLNFEVDIVPTATYVPGNPLEPLLAPPAPHLLAAVDSIIPSDGQSERLNVDSKHARKIPLWYDISDAIVPKMWRSALAAVLGLLAVRPGVSATELQMSLRPVLELWEIDEVLKWMSKAGAAQETGEGRYMVKEWWWMALGEAPEPDLDENGKDPDEVQPKAKKTRAKRAPKVKDKGKGKEKEREVNFMGVGNVGAAAAMAFN